ncbi:dihydroxyacetone kinase subunit DhaL [Micromonospora sp. NBC_00898]|uniref:dihydroxyacetone kinase subunit DhaL n=1 Tax=Micromonospora sp. NBC_00898 TaxID=2975981 RepID=UPI00386A92AE|nr:dihydroxyacetone kinase subunit DhaL [Micromonospora sp. NBC_00898]
MDDTLDSAGAVRWIEDFIARFEADRQELAELDRLSGDGDFGTNLTAALRRVRTALADGPPGSVSDVFARVSTAFLHTGGTSGPLFGMWFREFARATAEQEPADLEAVATATGAGAATVRRLGGAEVGHKTMVDAMVPAADALTAASAECTGLSEGLRRAAGAARAGAQATEAMVARRGRASYVGEAARGVLDPGAVTVALFFEAGAR